MITLTEFSIQSTTPRDQNAVIQAPLRAIREVRRYQFNKNSWIVDVFVGGPHVLRETGLSNEEAMELQERIMRHVARFGR